MLTCPHYYDHDINGLIQEAARTFDGFGPPDAEQNSSSYVPQRHYDSTRDVLLLQALRNLWYTTAVKMGLVPKTIYSEYWDLINTDGNLIDYDQYPDAYVAQLRNIEAVFMVRVKEQHDRLAAYLKPNDAP